jgi:hypothetical protein
VRKPKLAYSKTMRNAPPRNGPPTEEDFEIYASYQVNAAGLYIGTLKVVRKTDGRLLFPFAGARTAAATFGSRIVAGDIDNPEA